jgi:DNA-binding NtrC family response regulator
MMFGTMLANSVVQFRFKIFIGVRRMHANIFLVDQEEKFLQTLSTRLKSAGFAVKTSLDHNDALVSIEKSDIDVLVLGDPDDWPNFLGLIGEMKRLKPNVAIIILTPHVSSDYAIKAMKLGIYDCLPKPTNIGELIDRIREAGSRKVS